jgi:hypothetical protein
MPVLLAVATGRSKRDGKITSEREMYNQARRGDAHFMALVLSIGSDPSLMLTRKLLLEQGGHTVVGVMDEKALAAACELQTFDVAVLSHALSTKMKQHVVSLIRGHCPEVKVLELYSITSGRALKDADLWIEVPGDGPTKLVAGVAELAPR